MTPSRWLILFLAITMFVCRFYFVGAASIQIENQVIDRLNVEMSEMPPGSTFDANIIKARLKTREGGSFCQAEFDNDLKLLANDFDRIDPVIEFVDSKIFITLKIWPKPTIASIFFKGNCKISSEALSSELSIPIGSVFDRQSFNKAFTKLKTYYVTQGFFEAEVDYGIIPSEENCHEVDIEVLINEGRAGRIKKIIFTNFTQDETDALAQMIMTKPYFFLTSWLTDEGTYREEMVMQDEFQVLNYLQNEGYADAKVNVEVSEVENNRLIVNFKAYKGEKYHFGKVTVKGNTLYCTEDIENRIVFDEGQHYSPELLRLSVDSITSLYGKFGYIDAIIDYEPKIVCDQHVYDIEFTIDEGKQYRVGLIKVLGNCSTKTNVILNETLLVPGEVFNSEKLEVTEERLTNIGFFGGVNVYAVKSDETCELGDNYRDVHIEVAETNTGQFGASLGFSTSESLFGTISVTEKNFNSAGLPDVWSRGFSALRGGGEFAQLSTTVGIKNTSYNFSWSRPYFMDTKWTVGYEIAVTNNRYISDDYTIKTAGYTLRGGYQVNAFVKNIYHYRIKNSHINIDADHFEHEITKDLFEGDISGAKSAEHGFDKIKEEIRNSGIISAIGGAWIYDSTNHPIRPWTGLKSRFESEFAGLGGKHCFINFSYLNSYFYRLPFDDCGIWKFRADARFIQPIGQSASRIPIDERYFLGGGYTVRGYRPFRLGPRYDSDDPKGGISLQYLSIEYMRPLMSRVEGFLFADSGHLSMKQWHFGRMSTAVGFGLRINILPGSAPLTVGMGFPIDPHGTSEIKRFFLDIGGQF